MTRSPAPSDATGAQPRIPADRYFSVDQCRREWDRMWRQVWLLAADLADLRHAGDQVTFDLGPESIVIVRGEGERVRAFYNVCQHRGNRICHASKAHAMRLRCPYHHWQWDLEGRLVDLPDRHQFPSGAPASELGLAEVGCETWGGFAWVSMSPEPGPLAAYLAPLVEQLDRYPLTSYTRVHETTVELPCNWKTWIDAVNEAYHVHTSHPQLLPFVDEVNVEIELYERHSRHVVPFGLPSPRLGTVKAISPALTGLLRDAGVDPATFRGGAGDVRPTLQQAARERATRTGEGDRLEDRQLTDGFNYYAFPNTTFDMHFGRYTLLRARPHASDPERMYFDEWDYVRAPPGEVRSEPARAFRYGQEALSPVLEQDAAQLVRVQRGMHSRGFRGLYLGAHERRIRHMHETLEAYLGPADDGDPELEK